MKKKQESPINKDLLKFIGAMCKNHRSNLGVCQYDVAHLTGYTKETVSSFETGHNNNATLLLWYIANGLELSDLLSGYRGFNHEKDEI